MERLWHLLYGLSGLPHRETRGWTGSLCEKVLHTVSANSLGVMASMNVAVVKAAALKGLLIRSPSSVLFLSVWDYESFW